MSVAGACVRVVSVESSGKYTHMGNSRVHKDAIGTVWEVGGGGRVMAAIRGRALTLDITPGDICVCAHVVVWERWEASPC